MTVYWASGKEFKPWNQTALTRHIAFMSHEIINILVYIKLSIYLFIKAGRRGEFTRVLRSIQNHCFFFF